jgi:predicted nucleic acid-binding protein
VGRYVLDCSVAVKWFVPETLSDVAETLLADHQAGAIEFLAPEHVVAELGHTLRKLVSVGVLPDSEAVRGLAEFIAMRIVREPLWPLAARSLTLALTHMATFYDALYIALAEREDLKVLTADDGMANAFAGLKRTIRLADFAPPRRTDPQPVEQAPPAPLPDEEPSES